jgi:hypothetical protein
VTQQPDTRPIPVQVLPWWVAIIVILGALLTAAGGLIALFRPEMLLAPGQPMTDAAYVYAGYLISRNLALAAMLLIGLALHTRRGAYWALVGLLLLTALVQVLDAVVDATTGRVALVPVVLIVGVAFLVSALRLSGWRQGGGLPPGRVG